MGKYDTDQSTRTRSMARGEFSITEMDNFIRRHGQPVLWEKSLLSPLRSSSGYPRINGTDGGMGISYKEPEETYMMLQSDNRDFKSISTGDSTAGKTIATTRRLDKVAVRDRITVKDATIPENVLIKVTDRILEQGIFLRYDVKEVLAAISDDGDKITDIPKDKINIKNGKFYPDKSMHHHFVSIRLVVALRFMVTDILREGRAQYENDIAQSAPNRDRTELPTKLMLMREDMLVPDVMGLDSTPDGDVLNDEGNPSNLGGFETSDVDELSLNGLSEFFPETHSRN